MPCHHTKSSQKYSPITPYHLGQVLLGDCGKHPKTLSRENASWQQQMKHRVLSDTLPTKMRRTLLRKA